MRTSLSLLFLLLFGSVAAAQQPRPNVVVYVLDDVSHEDMKIVKQNLVPQLSLLDAVQFAGRDFRRAYSSPSCSPSRYEIMTGLLQHRDFVGFALCTECPSVGIAPRRTTLPEYLAVEGYETGLFGKAHFTGAAGTLQFAAAQVHGFETWRAGIPGNVDSHYNWLRIEDAGGSVSTQYSTEAIFESFEQWWVETSGPKFAVVAPTAPHLPFEAPPASLLPPGYQIGPTARDRFEAALAAVDLQIMASIAYLDLANTYIFVVSDNGTPTNVPVPNGREAGYKLTVHEGGIRTPFYAFGPGIVPGRDFQNLVQTVDVAATVFDLVGLSRDADFDDSISFAPALFGGPGARQSVLTQQFSPNSGTAASLDFEDWAVIRDDGWKLLEMNGVRQLYDLNSDPFESNPLAPQSNQAVTDQLLQIRSDLLGPDWPY